MLCKKQVTESDFPGGIFHLVRTQHKISSSLLSSEIIISDIVYFQDNLVYLTNKILMGNPNIDD